MEQTENGVFPIVIWKQIFQHFDDFRDFQAFSCVNKKFNKTINEMILDFRKLILSKYPPQSQKEILLAEEISEDKWNWKKIMKIHLRGKLDRCNRCDKMFAEEEDKVIYYKGTTSLPMIEELLCLDCMNTHRPHDLRKRFIIKRSLFDDLSSGEHSFDLYFFFNSYQGLSTFLMKMRVGVEINMKEIFTEDHMMKSRIERIMLFGNSKPNHPFFTN